MNFATWSIRNPIPTILLFVVLFVAGVDSFHQLSIASMPDLTLPRVNVILSEPGAAPAQLETEVAKKAEDSLATLSGLDHIKTTISEGKVEIRVSFVLEKNLSDALIETRNAIEKITSELPSDLETPSVSAQTVDSEPILTYAVIAPNMTEEALSWFIDDKVNKAVLSVKGVGQFSRVGGLQREIQVNTDPTKLTAYGASIADLSSAFYASNRESSGGKMTVGERDQAVRTIATASDIQNIQNRSIALSNGHFVKIGEVAKVQDTVQKRQQFASFDGQPVVGFEVYRALNADETKVAAGVQNALSSLGNVKGVHFELVKSRVTSTIEQYKGSMDMLYEGAILAIIIVWLFLRDWRATLISASALPLSILPAFIVMHYLDYSLNTLTLLALAVIVGILVDDAIVEIENIEQHVHMGKSIRQAASDAVNEIALPVLATTMTLVVVFLPTAMMSGIPGLFFKQFGWTAIIAILSSLLVARMLTPMMAAYLLKPRPQQAKQDSSPEKTSTLMKGYLQLVGWGLQHKTLTLISTTLFFLFSVALISKLDTGLIPEPNANYTTVSVELPPGSPIEQTQAKLESARKAIEHIAGIHHVFSDIGDDSGSSDVQKGQMIIVFSPRDERPSQSVIEQNIRSALLAVTGVRIAVGSGMGKKMELVLTSDDSHALSAASRALVAQLRDKVVGLSNIQSTDNIERPELVVRPNLIKASELGVTPSDIGKVVRVATAGDYDSQLSEFDTGSRQLKVRVQLDPSFQQSISNLNELSVSSRSGLIPLSSVADIRMGSGPQNITRYDRKRYVTISAELTNTTLGAALKATYQLPAFKRLPRNVSLLKTGDAEIMGELISGFSQAIVIGVCCILLVLILLFNDFFQPFTILSAIPLSAGGAFVALLLAHSELDVPSLIGLVMLMGIVSKNSILLVDHAVVAMKEKNYSLHDALLEACKKRVRPIVMTTIAMIAGMLPIALGLGADASFRQPMAIAVIGGLLTSTGLSLLVVPVVFNCVHSLSQRLFKSFHSKNADPVSLQ